MEANSVSGVSTHQQPAVPLQSTSSSHSQQPSQPSPVFSSPTLSLASSNNDSDSDEDDLYDNFVAKLAVGEFPLFELRLADLTMVFSLLITYVFVDLQRRARLESFTLQSDADRESEEKLEESATDRQSEEKVEEPAIGAVLVSTNQGSNAIIKPVIMEERGTKDCCPKEVCNYKREREGTPWVQCTACSQWYHCRCVGLTAKKADKLPEWFCTHCK